MGKMSILEKPTSRRQSEFLAAVNVRGEGSGLVSCYLLAVVLLALNHGSSSQSRI